MAGGKQFLGTWLPLANPYPLSLGLLWTRNWHVCQATVETVLRNGMLNPMLELLSLDAPTVDGAFEGEVTCIDKWMLRDPNPNFRLPRSLSMNSEESVTTTTCLESDIRSKAAARPFALLLAMHPLITSYQGKVTPPPPRESGNIQVKTDPQGDFGLQ
ncbi:hypothetical protein Fmac_011203 [Flemingia macrophylla]|uniref:Uncharacterized protein n=1 Tax=Flemingia macrophylla TaxID=520843 RepID=A0ABD1MLT0_9FABA